MTGGSFALFLRNGDSRSIVRSGRALSSDILERARVRAGLSDSRVASGNSLVRPGPARCCNVDLRRLNGRLCGEFVPCGGHVAPGSMPLASRSFSSEDRLPPESAESLCVPSKP